MGISRIDFASWDMQRGEPRGGRSVTINIGLVTSDAVVLGCDSVASTTGHYLDPFSTALERDGNGKPLVDENGKLSIKFDYRDLDTLVTSAWGGVTKMFEIHPSPCPMVAVTAGLAKLTGRPISDLARDFFDVQAERAKAKPRKGQKVAKLETSQAICDAFLEFMRRKFDEHYKDSPLPEELRDGPEFLVGGYGKGDLFPALYRIKVKENTVKMDFGNGDPGLSWNGQSDAVERFIRGWASEIRWSVAATIASALEKHSTDVQEYVTNLVNDVLEKTGQEFPAGIEIKIPELKAITIDWSRYSFHIQYGTLPLQEAVNFVSFLVMLQAGKARFVHGVPQVGGRCHVGIVTKADGFRPLNEPELTHRFTGFGDELR